MKHVGQVKYIEKSNLKVEVKSKNKRSEAQIRDTDEHQLKVLVEEQVRRIKLHCLERTVRGVGRKSQN